MSNRVNTLTVKMKGAATDGVVGKEGDSEDCSLTSWLRGKAGVACWGPPDRRLVRGGVSVATGTHQRAGNTLATPTCKKKNGIVQIFRESNKLTHIWESDSLGHTKVSLSAFYIQGFTPD